MNCSKCGKPMAVGAKKCVACGAESKEEYSYDLAPEEETKEKKSEEPKDFMLPPGVSAPAPSAPAAAGAKEAKPSWAPRPERQRGASLNSGGLSLKTMGIGAAVLAILVLLGMRMCSGPKVTLTMMNNKWSGTANVSNNLTKVYPFQLVGETSYRFKVEALDDEVRIGMPERGARDKVTPEAVKSWSLTPVKKGESHTLEGKVGTGSYSFVIVTDSKKGLRVKVDYEVKK